MWTQFDIVPYALPSFPSSLTFAHTRTDPSPSARRWSPADGVYLPGWIKHAMLASLGALQLLNLFWYALVLRILVR